VGEDVSDNLASALAAFQLDEEWRPVADWKPYEVSSAGRVRGYRGRLLKGLVTGRGYLGIILCADGAQQRRYIHDLVLTTFVGPRPPGYYSCHNNGIPDDNRLANLRWDTPSANNLDQLTHGTNFEAKKTHCPRGHVLAEPNLVIGELRRGGRKCRACNQARSVAQRNGTALDRTEADARYAVIMRGVA
jgi:HNH endonuclease/NUMOD4 motif